MRDMSFLNNLRSIKWCNYSTFHLITFNYIDFPRKNAFVKSFNMLSFREIQWRLWTFLIHFFSQQKREREKISCKICKRSTAQNYKKFIEIVNKVQFWKRRRERESDNEWKKKRNNNDKRRHTPNIWKLIFSTVVLYCKTTFMQNAPKSPI